MITDTICRKPNIRRIGNKTTIENIVWFIYPSTHVDIRRINTSEKWVKNIMNIIITEGTIGDVFRVKSHDETQVRILCTEYPISEIWIFIVVKVENMLKRKNIDKFSKIFKKGFSLIEFMRVGRSILIFSIIKQFYSIRFWIPTDPLPKELTWYIDPEILNVIISDEKGNYYRIVEMEYDFLMKHGLPLPTMHWLERMKAGFIF